MLTANLAELTKQGAEVGLFVEFRTNTGLRRDARLSGQVGIRNGYVEFSNRTGKPHNAGRVHGLEQPGPPRLVDRVAPHCLDLAPTLFAHQPSLPCAS